MRLLKIVPDDTNIDFVRLRSWAFGLTAFLTVLAVGASFAKGLNLGVDFVGGLMIEAKFQQEPSLDKLRSNIDRLNVGDASLGQYSDKTLVAIRLPIPKNADQGATNAEVQRVQASVAKEFPGVTFTRTDTVSGKVSGELIRSGVLAVLLAVFARASRRT